MPRTDSQPSYSAQYHTEVVAWFLATGKTVAQVADELNLPEATVRQWVAQAANDSVAVSGPTSAPVAERASPTAPSGAWPVTKPADWYDADAVRWIQETGTGMAEAAYRLGVAEATVRRWLQLAVKLRAASGEQAA